MGITIQSLLQTHLELLTSARRLSKDMWNAALRLAGCRTSAMGIHVRRCPDYHVSSIAYNSCRHRCCQVCGGLERERWLDRWKARLLPCPHHHAVFTIPRKVLMIVFRGKFRGLVLKALQKGELKLPPPTSVNHWTGEMNRLGRVPWNVKIFDRYEHGRGVVRYLARYLRGGPIGVPTGGHPAVRHVKPSSLLNWLATPHDASHFHNGIKTSHRSLR